jgi:hypothetical protein
MFHVLMTLRFPGGRGLINRCLTGGLVDKPRPLPLTTRTVSKPVRYSPE